MEKENLYWVAAFAAVAAAVLVYSYLQTPRERLILTYQASEPSVWEDVSAETETTEPAQTTAQTLAETVTIPVQTTLPAPLNRDLNTATAEDLKRVSGIGDVLAAEIIAYRAQIGGFTRRTQLTEISGIGEVLMERIMEEFEIPNELPPEPDIPEPQIPVYVPEDEPYPDAEPEPEPELPPQPTGPYNVNTVTREELLTIPDMTEALADAILSLRERLEGFGSIYELMYAEPNGVYFEDVLRDYLYVEGDPYSRQPNTE